MKGISPLIAIVLLIAFTVAVGGLLFAWGGGYLKTTGERIGGVGEKATKCSYSHILVDPVKTTYDFSGGPPEELKVFLTNAGPVDLYNFTFLVTTTEGTWELVPENQKTEENPLKPGYSELFKATSWVDIYGEPKYIKITALCLGIKIEAKVPLIK